MIETKKNNKNKRKFRKDQNYFCAYALKHKHTLTWCIEKFIRNYEFTTN